MDIAAASTATAGASVNGAIGIALLKAQEKLASSVGAELAASIGLGSGFDAYA
ncbi:MAG: hypothetical protein JO199_02540 [Candidatus Eremiobacteraeota bacterium]|nr:hypothetical protein [Candidatus Eremiobacteraeota bacterium]